MNFAVRAIGTGTATKRLCNTPTGILESPMMPQERIVPYSTFMDHKHKTFIGMTTNVLMKMSPTAKLTSFDK